MRARLWFAVLAVCVMCACVAYPSANERVETGIHHWQKVKDSTYDVHDVWVCEANGRMDDAEVMHFALEPDHWTVYVRGTGYGEYTTEEQAKQKGIEMFNARNMECAKGKP